MSANGSVRIISFDAGERKNNLKFFDSATNTDGEISINDFSNLASQASFNSVSFDSHSKTRLVIEGAHATPRTKHSLAQLITKEELVRLTKSCSKSRGKFVFEIFPEQLTPRALVELGCKKDKEDSKAICNFCIKYPNFTFKKIKSVKDIGISEEKKEIIEWRQELGKDVNSAQAINFGMEKKFDIVDRIHDLPVTQLIMNNIDRIYEFFDDLARDFFQLNNIYQKTWLDSNKKRINLSHCNLFKDLQGDKRRFFAATISKSAKNGIKALKNPDFDWCYLHKLLYVAANGVFDIDGNRRTEVRGINHLMRDYLVMSPYHQQGGPGRAILMHFCLPSYTQRKWNELYETNWPGYRATNINGRLNEKGKVLKANNKGDLIIHDQLNGTHYADFLRDRTSEARKCMKQAFRFFLYEL